MAATRSKAGENGGRQFNDDGDDAAIPGEATVPTCCGYPRAVPFIIGNEFCERFSYYGMRAILVLYFKSFLDLSNSDATVYYHVFVMLCYLTPAFGGMLADSGFGKFRTILVLSIVYCIGNIVMSITAIPSVVGDPPTGAGAIVGLGLIAIGTGGIKPCVASFGGDQFPPSLAHKLQGFFAAFYFSINAGSVISTILTPILRADVGCFGMDECYALAFGVPAILMCISLAVFMLGTRYYIQTKPERNVMLDFVKVMYIGIKNKLSRKPNKPQYTHWLEPAAKKFGQEFVSDVRGLLSVLLIFLPTPLFWTLFDQQGSRWTLQAEQMKSVSLGPLGYIRPDQMQALNSLFVLALIPVFERAIYPALRFLRIPARPLQRMAAGMLLCGLAFVVSGLVQIRIDNAMQLPALKNKMVQVRVMNLQDDSVSVRGQLLGTSEEFLANIAGSDATDFESIQSGNWSFGLPSPATTSFLLQEKTRYSLVIDTSAPFLRLFEDDLDRHGGDLSTARVRFYNAYDDDTWVSIWLDDHEEPAIRVMSPNNLTSYDNIELESGKHTFASFAVNASDPKTIVRGLANLTLHLDDGADYTFVVHANGTVDEIVPYTDVGANTVTMLWQIPQYIVMTCGEILFSVTGLEFAFVEAPDSMKAVVQAAWLLTTAFGSLIVIIIAESSFVERQQDEFFLFAGIMGVVTLLFGWLALSYKYRRPAEIHSRSKTASPADSEGDDTLPLMTHQPTHGSVSDFASFAYDEDSLPSQQTRLTDSSV